MNGPVETETTAEKFQLVEGFKRILTAPSGPDHSVKSANRRRPPVGLDFRGLSLGWWTLSWWRRPVAETPPLEWETHAPPARLTTVFSFVGSSSNTPYNVFPHNRARLFVNGAEALSFELGVRTSTSWSRGRVRLEFIPKRTQWPAEGYHRQFEMHGNSGIYRLTLPPSMIKPGEPVRLRVDTDAPQQGTVSFFMIKDRQDTLEASPRTQGEEIAQLQADIADLRRVVSAHAKRLYPEIFPERVRSSELVLFQQGREHCNDLDLAVAEDGELMLTFRQASEHVAPFGRQMLLRSHGGGLEWVHDEARVIAHFPWPIDTRVSVLHRLGGGAWLATIVTFGNHDESGEALRAQASKHDYRTWMIRSSDDGRSWSTDPEPLDPGPLTDNTCYSPAVRLPNGRLLMPMGSCLSEPRSASLFASGDGGRSWAFDRMIGEIPAPYVSDFPETTITRTRSGRLLAMVRVVNGNYLLSSSADDGHTWAPWRETPMPCYATRARLTTLTTGEVVCSYALRPWRGMGLDDLGSVKLAVSRDEGETWSSEDMRILRDDFLNWDFGYPITVELRDGRLFTAYWANQLDRFFIAGHVYERWWR